jgi:SnoaL-like domain
MSLESRLTELEDRIAIGELRASYCHLADERRWEELADLFAEDAEFRALSSVRGRAELLEYLRGLPDVMDAFWHRTMNETLVIEGDSASGRAYFDAPCVVDGRSMLCAGRYRDEFVKEHGRWRFGSRQLDFFYFTPLTEGWREGALPPELARN